MGCNCNKGTRKAISEAQSAQASTKQANQLQTTANTKSTPAPRQGARATQSFTLKTRDGRTQTFGSKLEAEAENVRIGYTGTVKPA